MIADFAKSIYIAAVISHTIHTQAVCVVLHNYAHLHLICLDEVMCTENTPVCKTAAQIAANATFFNENDRFSRIFFCIFPKIQVIS